MMEPSLLTVNWIGDVGEEVTKKLGFFAGHLQVGAKMTVGLRNHYYYLFRVNETDVKVSTDQKEFVESPQPPVIDPAIWGPPKWHEFHTAARRLPDETFKLFLLGFSQSIPCGECKRHLREILADHPFETDSFPWSVAVHNELNKLLQKPTFSLRDAETLYPI